MSQEVVKATAAPRALTMTKEETAQVKEAFAINVMSGTISVFDLPRIKVMSGAALWLIPKLEGDETAPSVDGVIVHAREIRAYYAKKDAGNVPPDCSSMDAITGVAKPGINLGGQCSKCPMSQFGSANDGDSDGQACKHMAQLFILRGESMLPEVLSLPPTSLKGARQFFLKSASQGVPYKHALVSIALDKAQNSNGQIYGKARINFLRRLSPEEAELAVEFGALVQGILDRPQIPAIEAQGNQAAE